MGILLLVIPLITFGLLWIGSDKRTIYLINAAGSAVLLLASGVVAKDVLGKGYIAQKMFNDMFYIDSFSCLLLVITAFIGFLVSVYSIGYMDEEFRARSLSLKKLKVYFSLLHGFIFTMILTLSTQNMGMVWIAVEATTLASAFLVGFYNNKNSIEAAWKYIIICSVGIAFALLGIVLLYYSSVQSLGQNAQGLNWRFLFDNSDKLQGSILKIAFIFILVGFGTKVGLAPMHTWLPDAHSQAPAPISALLSGVLLNTAMYGIVRVMIIVNKNLGSDIFTGRLLIALGIMSIGTAAVFIILQRDFKRALAYSSIEHMGIIALGFGMLSPLGIFGALYHTVNHAFTKSMLFMASGNVYLKYHSKQAGKVKGIISVMPATGIVFLLGIFAITGMPPFGIFNSEISIIIALFTRHKYITAGLLIVFLILVFSGFMTQLVKMFYGSPADEGLKKGEISTSGIVVLWAMLVIVAVLGIYLPSPVKELMDSAGKIISGGVQV